MSSGSRSATWPRRRRLRWGRAFAVAALLVLAAAAAYWAWRRATLNWSIARGLELRAAAQSGGEFVAALERWEAETAPRWSDRRDALTAELLKRDDFAERRVQLLLARVTGADYGARLDDWRHWHDTSRRLDRGEAPRVPNSQRVRLEPAWSAAVGLTAWFSAVLPLDGQIYVASLGESFGSAHDSADGIVRIDGRSGTPELFFEPPDGGIRDVLGIAAGTDCLFAACRNGYVYCVELNGALRWSARAGEPLAAAPLALDINRGGVNDVLVVRADGKVLAISGRSGKTAWVSAAPKAPGTLPGAEFDVGATLAVGSIADESGRDIVVTTVDGTVRVLAARSGATRWEGTLPAGSLAGAVCVAPGAEGPPGYLGDRDACAWALLRARNSADMTRTWDLYARPGDTLIAGLRTLGRDSLVRADPTTSPAGPPLLVACPTGDYSADQGAVCLLLPEGVRWRYPTRGAIWATPALADINEDDQTEIIVASINADPRGKPIGVLTVLSASGQCLRREILPAPVECSPVVADVNGDNRLEVLVADQSGLLHCFKTGQAGVVEWGLAGGDSQNTRNAENADRFGHAPVGAQWRWQPR